MKKVFVAAFVCLLIAPALLAKPKQKTYDAAVEQVFKAALRVAKAHHNVTYVDEKNGLITFQTGASAFSWGYECNASVEEGDKGKTVLAINVQKKQGVGKQNSQLTTFGAGGRMADKFFKWVDEELKKPAQTSDNKPGEK